jgi:hypothetical protein
MSSISLANIKMQRMAAETVFLIPGSLPAADLERYATNLLHPLPESGDNMAIRCAAFNSFHAHVWGQGKAARMAWSKTWAREQRSVTALQC